MKAYISLFKLRLIAGMQYRAAAWAGIATQFFFGLVFMSIYLAFYSSSSAEPPMKLEELMAYLWCQQAFLALIMPGWRETDLMANIVSGNVAYDICRPYGLFEFTFVKTAAERLVNMSMRCPLILIVAFFLPKPYTLMLPYGAGAAGLFILSIFMALALITAISMFVYIITFKTMSSIGARIIVGLVAEFCCGATIPIPLMPLPLQRALDFLPFRYVSDLPFRIYSGNINTKNAAAGIMIQAVWILLLISSGKLLFGQCMKKVVIQGG